MNDFFKKNLNGYHITGIVLGTGLSLIYWAKAGRFTDNVLKNNPWLMTLWGILIGYIMFDFIFNALKKKNKEENE